MHYSSSNFLNPLTGEPGSYARTTGVEPELGREVFTVNVDVRGSCRSWLTN